MPDIPTHVQVAYDHENPAPVMVVMFSKTMYYYFMPILHEPDLIMHISPEPSCKKDGLDEETSKICRSPLWFTAYGAARNCDFHPTFTADAYADEAALVQVICEKSGKTANVGLTWSHSREGDQNRNRLSQGNLSPRSAYLEADGLDQDAGVFLASLVELWICEDGTWLKLDDMARAATPMIRKRIRSPFRDGFPSTLSSGAA